MTFDIDAERARFEQAAMDHFHTRRQQGNVLDDNGCPITRESLFWRDDKGDYGVRMFNAAWWGWKSACEAMTPIVTKVPAGWQSIGTAPKDNTRLLYLARFDDEGALIELDYDGIWEYWSESYEMPHINGWTWMSANGIEEPTHWCYQEEHLAPAPGEAAREYMTGYSDCKEWAGATNQALVGALKDATQSLETISMLAGRKTYGNPPLETFMETFSEVRGYAISRAGVGREAIAAINAKGPE